jgi:hypothetical protein
MRFCKNRGVEYSKEHLWTKKCSMPQKLLLAITMQANFVNHKFNTQLYPENANSCLL